MGIVAEDGSLDRAAVAEVVKKQADAGVIQAGSSLGIMIPPSVVLVLYGMIARQPVGQLWLAGVFPGLLLAAVSSAHHAAPHQAEPPPAPAPRPPGDGLRR